jgi:hypothetical protein
MNVVLRQPETEEDFISLANLARELAEYHQDNFCPNPDKLRKMRSGTHHG